VVSSSAKQRQFQRRLKRQGRRNPLESMSRSHYLAALSLGIAWIALTTCRNGGSDPERGLPHSVEGLGGHRVVAPRLTGKGSTTVGELEQTAAEKPRDARILNDLAASYFIRAHKKDQPEDLVRALDVFARAHAADPSLPETRFNLALTLERLHLTRLAQESWKSYLELKEGSSWDQEAERHLQEFSQPSASQRWSSLLPELEAATLRGDEDLVLRLVKVSPQSAREFALETSLGGWGDALQAGDKQTAARQLQIVSQVGKALRSVSGDETVLLSVDVIEKAAEEPARVQALATGYREFRDGMSAFRPLRTGEAAVHFVAARKALAGSRSPVEQWALCGLARCWGYEGRYGEAIAAYRAILADSVPRGCFSLTGWTQWGWAWIAARQGFPMEALSRSLATEEAYQRAGEAENLGAARFMISESLFLLGQRESGWRYTYSALEALSTLPTIFRRHVLLTATATDALEEGLPDASLLIQDEALRIAKEIRDPIRLTETYKARAKILATLRRTEEALQNLAVAKSTAQRISQDSTGRKIRADLLWAEGEVVLRRDPRNALQPLSWAIEEYRAMNASTSAAYALLTRAKAHQSVGSNQEAQADFEDALNVIESHAADVGDGDLLLSYMDSVEDAYDELIRFKWEENRRFPEALHVLERSRNLTADSALPSLLLEQLPADGVVVEYALLKDRVLIWVMDRHGCQSFEKKVWLSEVNLLVERFLDDLDKGANEETIQQPSSRLHDLLIPPSVENIAADKVIYFVPDKSLNRVPYAALWNDRSRRYFVQDHTLAISPSLANLLRIQKPSEKVSSGIKSALLVGNPTFDRALFQGLENLPDAEKEIRAAQDSFGDSHILTGKEATKSQILDQLDHFDIFVFAGHALSNQSFPSQSYLVLAPSAEPPDAGVLLAKEIRLGKFRRLRLVVLSACSSIGPRAARASGLTGIARPFLSAGASNVVGTLWNIRDKESAMLLPVFYRSTAKGKAPICALREMQLAAIGRGKSGARTLRAWSSFEIVTGH
jgi:CHAT domain-containing protein